MKKGDLVRIKVPKPIPGALTAVKFFQRLTDNIEGKVGIIISPEDPHTIDGKEQAHQTSKHVIVQFPNIRKLIHVKYLEVIGGDQ